MNGQVGHGRNLTQQTNFTNQGLFQPNAILPGWGTNIKNLYQPNKVHALPEKQQYHKKFWDFEPGKIYLKTSGFFSSHLDRKMGMCFDDLEGVSVRQQREIITNRAKEINKLNNLEYQLNYKGNASIIH